MALCVEEGCLWQMGCLWMLTFVFESFLRSPRVPQIWEIARPERRQDLGVGQVESGPPAAGCARHYMAASAALIP